jgi:DNA-directed RNA polymerase specialized sigma24 family protein
MVITARKAAHQIRDEGRQKRGGCPQPTAAPSEVFDLEQILSREPAPEFAAEVADEWQRLVALLGDSELEAVALLRMEGYTVEEIAHKLSYVPRSIKRKLSVFRAAWEKEVTP